MKKLITGIALVTGLGASAAQAAEVTRYAVAMPHNRCMIVGMTPKQSSGTIVIPYGMKFKKPPVVSVSPVWITTPGDAVNHIETITEIGLDHFSDTSGSFAASNFYVSWTAVGIAKASVCR